MLAFESGAAVASISGECCASRRDHGRPHDYAPLAAHVLLDYVLVAVLIALPFVAGFSDETGPRRSSSRSAWPHLLVTIGTRFQKRET